MSKTARVKKWQTLVYILNLAKRVLNTNFTKYTLTHTYAGHLKLSHCVAAYAIVECILFISWPDLLATSWWPFKIQTNKFRALREKKSRNASMLATHDFSLWLSCSIMMRFFFAWIYRFAFTLRFICKQYCDRLQVVRMFIAVVTIFAICWLPYHMFYVYAYHQPNITSTKNTPHLFLTFYWLAMSNSMVNPIIYYWMNRRFRHYFQRILCFCCFRLWKMDDTFLQRNSMSIERKPRLCKYFHFILIQLPLPNAFARGSMT